MKGMSQILVKLEQEVRVDWEKAENAGAYDRVTMPLTRASIKARIETPIRVREMEKDLGKNGRHMSDVVREQVRKLREELVTARRLKWIKDGTAATPTNSPAEVDATNAPGLYKLALTGTECTCDFATLAGISPRSDGKIVIYSENYGEEKTFDASAPPVASKHWSDYPLGVTSILAGEGHATPPLVRIRNAIVTVLETPEYQLC